MAGNLENKLRFAKKQTAYAWAKYYEELEISHVSSVNQYNINNQVAEVEELPLHLVMEIADLSKKLKKEISCPICFDVIEGGDLKITGCGHKYCKECFTKINECAVCRKKIKK